MEISSDEIYKDSYLNITDMTGKIISSQKANLVVGTTQIVIDDLELQKGVYLVTLFVSNKPATKTSLKPVKVMVK